MIALSSDAQGWATTTSYINTTSFTGAYRMLFN